MTLIDSIGYPEPTSPFGEAVRQIRKPGLHATIVRRAGLREFHITVWPLPGERSALAFGRLDSFLNEHPASVVRQEVFGAIEAYDECLEVMHRLFGEVDWPLTWVEGDSCQGNGIAGMHVFAVSNVSVAPVCLDGAVVGRVFTDRWARHCLLSGIRPTHIHSPKTDQTTQIYQQIERALGLQDMVLSDTARTWLYLDKILDWYGPFNTVRTEIFTQRHLFDRGVPASTGIGAKNPFGAALVAGAWAVRPLDTAMRVHEIQSPLQCSARSYGSCFSRAVEMCAPGHRRLLISGTASIGADGRTVHAGDLRRQIQVTMDVVEAILRSRTMDWSCVTRATAYLKRKQDAAAFRCWCAERMLVLPLVVTQADICRDELLFEIEVDAIVSAPLNAGADLEV